MKIKKLILDNVKSYTHAEFDFENGINFVSGKNGAGKTTIIESIGYALFNYKIVEQHFADYYITRMQNKASVRVIFENKEGKEYIVYRKLSKSNASNSWSIKDSETELEIVSKDEEVKSWLKDNLGFYPDDNIADIYKNIVSVPQGEYTSVFLASDNERKSKFDPIFNLEGYKKIYNNMSELPKGLQKKIIELEKNVSNNQVRLDGLKETQEKLANVILELNEIKSELITLDIDEKQKQKEFDKIEILKLQLNENINELKILETKKESYTLSSESKKQDLGSATKALDITNQNKNDYEEYLKLEKEKEPLTIKAEQYTNLNKQKENLERKIKLSEQQNIFNKENYDKYEKEYIDLNNEIIKIVTLSDDITLNIKQEEIGINTLSTVLAELKDVNDNIKRHGNAIEISKVKYNEIQMQLLEKEKEINKIPSLEKRCNDIKEILKNDNDVDNKIEEYKKQLAQSDNKQKSIDDIIVNLSNGICPYLKEQCKNIDSKNIEEYKKEKEVIAQTAIAIEKELKILKEQQKEFTLLKEELTTKNTILTSLLAISQEIENLKQKANSIKEDIDKENNLVMEQYENITCEVTNIEQYILTKENELSTLKILHSSNSTDLANKQAQKNELDIKIKELSNQIILLKNEILNREEAEKNDNAKLNELSQEINKYKEFMLSLEQLEIDMKSYYSSYMLYMQNINTANKYEQIKDELNKLEASINDIIININDINAKINLLTVEFSIDEYNNIKIQLEEVRKNVSAKKAIQTEKSIQKQMFEKELEKTITIKQHMEQDNNNILIINKALDNLSKIRNIINDAPKYISKVLIKKISERASNIYSNIALDNTRLEWQEGYSLVLYDNINGCKICKEFKQLSGGEQMSAALSVRIAMLETMTKLHIGILDEPTTNMDIGRRTRLAEIIEDIGGMFKQLFIVSHDDTFNSITDNIIELDNMKEDVFK